MKFLANENIPKRALELLKEHGIDIERKGGRRITGADKLPEPFHSSFNWQACHPFHDW